MKIAFSRRALRQIEDIHHFIAAHDVEAARRVVGRIRELCDALADFPGIGTMTDQPTVRALPLVRYP